MGGATLILVSLQVPVLLGGEPIELFTTCVRPRLRARRPAQNSTDFRTDFSYIHPRSE